FQPESRDRVGGGRFMRTALFAGVMAMLACGPALAQGSVAGQPTLMAPPAGGPAKPPVAARPSSPAKPPQAAARPAPTPESRSAAQLAVSSGPVFDEDTFQRIKDALLFYSDIQVRGGWPTLPAEAKLAPGASGPEVATLRQRLVISDDMPAKEGT